MEKKITYISTDKIIPHIHNPRKDLGDLTELTESIKKVGIMQNLTVVIPEKGNCAFCTMYNHVMGYCQENHDKNLRTTCSKYEWNERYVVVIGHRRLAAAKLAGLAEVPCIISDMDYKEQIATMLLENMQRTDLTVYEQAKGFQLMMNLGESTQTVADMTGFSESTIRRRIKLLDLDQQKFREADKRGATLMDYAELEKIESIELKNKVLESIGTNNFDYELRKAIDTEKEEKWRAKAIEVLNSFATKIEERDFTRHIFYDCYYASHAKEIKVPENVNERSYCYETDYYGCINIYIDREEGRKEVDTARVLERERERAKREEALDEVSKRAYDLRFNFVLGLSNANAKKNINLIMEHMISNMEANLPENEDTTKLLNEVRFHPEKCLLAAVYTDNDSHWENYYSWDGSHHKNEELDEIYEFLEALGYEMSDEEKAMRDGTHELFAKEEPI